MFTYVGVYTHIEKMTVAISLWVVLSMIVLSFLNGNVLFHSILSIRLSYSVMLVHSDIIKGWHTALKGQTQPTVCFYEYRFVEAQPCLFVDILPLSAFAQ